MISYIAWLDNTLITQTNKQKKNSQSHNLENIYACFADSLYHERIIVLVSQFVKKSFPRTIIRLSLSFLVSSNFFCQEKKSFWKQQEWPAKFGIDILALEHGNCRL
jgi:hypothetical protein